MCNFGEMHRVTGRDVLASEIAVNRRVRDRTKWQYRFQSTQLYSVMARSLRNRSPS
jgi:hypothetical protein